MLMVCHHLDKNIPEDVAFTASRRHYTINGAIAHGMSHLIGPIEKGKVAAFVLQVGAQPQACLLQLFFERRNCVCETL
jgi:urease alpha subunit